MISKLYCFNTYLFILITLRVLTFVIAGGGDGGMVGRGQAVSRINAVLYSGFSNVYEKSQGPPSCVLWTLRDGSTAAAFVACLDRTHPEVTTCQYGRHFKRCKRHRRISFVGLSTGAGVGAPAWLCGVHSPGRLGTCWPSLPSPSIVAGRRGRCLKKRKKKENARFKVLLKIKIRSRHGHNKFNDINDAKRNVKAQNQG